MKLKIAIVGHGRFTTFQLARALLERGHDVHLFTNYPGTLVPRFGFPADRVDAFGIHGITSRLCSVARNWHNGFYPERWLHETFGRWAARTVARQRWDFVYCYSGGAEELFRALRYSGISCWLARGSTHIRTQARLLQEEERRAGVPIDKPSPWMIDREEREYSLADVIVTQSTFAAASFPQSLAERVLCIPLGVDVESFRASKEEIAGRQFRICNGAKLRVLFVGTKSFRKGLLDLAEITRRAAGRFEIRLVGPTESAAISLVNDLGKRTEVQPAVPEAKLREIYAWGDLFVFPTIEDGFAMVLAQAHANGLPILATSNCAAPDLIHEGGTGWILPIRCPAAFVEKLEWCDQYREELAKMVASIVHNFHPRTWDDVARDHESAFLQRVARQGVCCST
ncbi:MAG TPA: glycosyltransferase family 4 protein [Verrucomicrobiae bacterium]|nr:glycosyltransferase family 4 protein [Verrucomicrobiae bacterium]